MQAEPVRSVQLGPLQITLATGERGELLHLMAAPPEVRMRLKGVSALPVSTGEVSMRSCRQTVLEPVRGRMLAALSGDLEEEEVCVALRAAAAVLFALAAEGALLPGGSVNLTTLVQGDDGRWQFDLVGATLQVDGGQERLGPEAHLRALVQGLRLRAHLGRAPRLRRLALLLAERSEVSLGLVEGVLVGKSRSDGSRFTWRVAAGAGLLFLTGALVTGVYGGRVLSRSYRGTGGLAAPEVSATAETRLYRRGEAAERSSPVGAGAQPRGLALGQAKELALGQGGMEVRQPVQEASGGDGAAPGLASPAAGPALAQGQPAASPAPTPATPAAPTQPAPAAPLVQPARPVGSIDLVISHPDGVAVLHAWAGEGTTWVSLDDLVTFLGARLEPLPSGGHLLTWQFGSLGIAARTEVEITDAKGARYVLLGAGLQGSMRLHPVGWDAGNLFYERERPF